MDKVKKQKQENDPGPGYDEGFKAAYDSAYFKGYDKGKERSYVDTGVYAVGAYTIFNQLKGLYQGLFTKTAETVAKETGFWNFLASTIANYTPQQILDLPNTVGTPIHTVLNTLCGYTTKNCTEILMDASKIGKGTLTAVGISLAAYLYIQFRGTEKEKQILKKKIREARRSTEETSDRHIKRRRTNKLRQLSEVESASMSESESQNESESDFSSNRSNRKRRRKGGMTKRKLSR
jgi:hypothetical protein